MSLALFSKRLVIVEVAALGVAYLGFTKLNRDVEFRRSVHSTAPFVIDAFSTLSGKSVEELLADPEDPATTAAAAAAAAQGSSVASSGGPRDGS